MVKKYIESAGKEGVDQTEGAQSLHYNLMNLSPITRQPLGDYNGYNNTTFNPTMKAYKSELIKSKGEFLKLHPEKTIIESGLFSSAGNKLYTRKTTGEEVTEAQAVEDIINMTLATDPRIVNYDTHINTIFGRYDKAKQYADENTYQGIGPFSPNHGIKDEYIKNYNNYLNQENNNLATAAGIEYQKHDKSITYSDITNPQWGIDYQHKLDNNLTTYNGPAVNIPGLGVQPVELNPDGSLKSTNPGIINMVKNEYAKIGTPGYNAIDFINGIFKKGSEQTDGLIPNISPSGLFEDLGLSNKQPSTQSNTELQNQLEKSAVELRLQFPDLNKTFPYKANKTKDGVIFDQNAGQLINFAATNLSNNTVTTKYLKPDDPTKFNKDLFSYGGFNDLIYKSADGTSLTKNDALKAMGYDDGKVPQKTIDATKISSIGTFLEPGYIHGTMPDSEGNVAQISIEPSAQTQQAFQNTNYAKDAYKTFTKIENKQIIGGDGKIYIADYVPTYENKRFGVKIETYIANPDGTKGNYVNTYDAFDIYEQELHGWAKSNNITIDKR